MESTQAVIMMLIQFCLITVTDIQRSEDGSTFISEDPIRDGMNWYGDAGCKDLENQQIIVLFIHSIECFVKNV